MHIVPHNLVFIPGWGYRASVMSPLTPYFQEHYLQLYNLPAFANSNVMINLSELAAKFPAETTLIGWSLGGLIAIKLCSQFPNQFKKLILLSSSPKFTAAENWLGITADRAQSFSDKAKQNLHATMDEFRKLVCYPSHAAATHEHFAAHVSDNSMVTPLLNSLEYLFHADLRKDFSSLKQPILSIAGSHDAILPPGQHNHHIIQDAGHGFFFTHPEQTSQLILEFLGRSKHE